MLPEVVPIRPILLKMLPVARCCGIISIMTELRKHKKRRIPKLSAKSEPGTMRYYASYRGPDGKPKRKRFSKDRKESEIAYHRWVVENYDQSPGILTSDNGAVKANIDQSFPIIANAYIPYSVNIEQPLNRFSLTSWNSYFRQRYCSKQIKWLIELSLQTFEKKCL